MIKWMAAIAFYLYQRINEYSDVPNCVTSHEDDQDHDFNLFLKFDFFEFLCNFSIV